MKKILNTYINKMRNGLLLLDAPTGYGKTWAVIQYINQKLNNELDSFNHIFYVTNMKKNIDINNKVFVSMEKLYPIFFHLSTKTLRHNLTNYNACNNSNHICC